jgi:hypothetical protein
MITHALNTPFLTLFVLLIFGHCLADYPLQGDFLASAKRGGVAGIPWWMAMLAHAWVHAGFVLIFTHSMACAIGELIVHFAIDFGKTRGAFTFSVDQAAHVVCKIVWCAIVVAYGAH